MRSDALNLTRLFPPALLNASVDERTSYFMNVTVEHPKFDEALETCLAKIDPCIEERFLLLCGPTGCGKSALQKQLRKQLILAQRREMEKDKCLLPAIAVQAEAPNKGPFDNTHLHASMLTAMRAPLVEATREYQELLRNAEKAAGRVFHSKRRSDSAGAILDRCRLHLKLRRVRCCSIDEAGLMFTTGVTYTRVQRMMALQQQANKLRSLVNGTPTCLVLAGAYDFFDLSQTSGQLARRSRIVHLEAYGTSEEDVIGFCKGLIGLLAHLPAEHTIDPRTDGAEICIYTAGCIGIASDLLRDTLLTHLRTGKPFDMALVRKHFMSAAALETIRAEMIAGAKEVNRLLGSSDVFGVDDESPPSVPQASAPRSPLKPGDTKPSHRA